MIVEPATVLRRAGAYVWVTSDAQAGCARCASGQGCGGALWSRLLGERLTEVRVLSEGLDLRPGQQVRVGVPESALLGGSALVYGLPLLLLLAGAMLGAAIVPSGGDLPAIAGAAAGLLTGLGLIRVVALRLSYARDYQPRIIGVGSVRSTATARFDGSQERG